MRNRVGLVLVLAAGLLLLAGLYACAPAPAPKTQAFDLLMGEQIVIAEAEGGADEEIGEFHRWEPAILVVKKGDTVVIHVTNPRKNVHGFAIPGYGVSTGPLEPRGGEETVQFVADRAGVFPFACNQPWDADTAICNIDHEFMTGYLLVLE